MQTRLLYVSNGNIPSRWAHTVQIMKMSEALASLVPAFRLLIPGALAPRATTDAAIFDWYGIQKGFRLSRLPMGWRLGPRDLDRSNWRLFSSRARWYARLLRPRLLMTRCHETADYALRDGLPLLFETHDGPGHPKTLELMARLARYPRLAGVITTSETLKTTFCAEGLRPEQVLAIPNAVDVDRFNVPSTARARARAELGVRDETFLVAYTGSLRPHKGIETVIAAARLRPEYRFVTVGGDVADIVAWRADAATASNLAMLPFVPNSALPAYLAAADACLVPNSAADRTAGWTFSLKFYEYLASARPVVASDIPSLRAATEDGDLALLVPPDDPQAVAAALDLLHRDPALAVRLGERGRRRMAEQTWQHRARRVLETFAPGLLDLQGASAGHGRG
jgi:glycosyltransferase involved in cell wall biosynthesis